MSRSYRKPYHAITNVDSAKEDKRMARRGVRRAHRATIAAALDHEDLLLPHRRECAWNNPYSWGRDGSQHYFSQLDAYWSDYAKHLMRK
jgi:hypothetical protein